MVDSLLKEIKFAVIKGNMAEIKTLLEIDSLSRGVDSLEKNEIGEEIVRLAAKKFGSIVVITGEIDYIGNQ